MFYKIPGIRKLQKIIGLELYPVFHTKLDII